MATIHIRTQNSQQVVDVTHQVEDLVADGDVTDGLCHVFVPHATAAIVLNESADPEIGNDLLELLDTLVPAGTWRHDRIDDNGASHLKAAVLGPGEVIPIVDGRLALGTWQAVMLVELDGPRDRTIRVTLR